MENEIDYLATVTLGEMFNADDAPAREELTEKDLDNWADGTRELVPGRKVTWDHYYLMGE